MPPSTPLPPPQAGSSPPSPTASPRPSLKARIHQFAVALEGDRSGVLSLLVVLVVGVILAYVLWTPFAQPAKAINDAFPTRTA